MPLRIRNWHHFQQYKDRCPPWIKLHREILQSEDWVMWDDASRVLAIACMLLASRTEDGSLPANPGYIKRAAYLNTDPDLQPLINCGFLELEGDDSKAYKTLASCTTETETETETERETEKRQTPASKKFTPPTVAEVSEHVAAKGYTFDPEAFVAHYTANGWRVGRNPMKSWHAACVTWQKREGKGKAPMRVGATPGDHEWIYDTYRRADMDAHSDHERWDEYVAASADYPPRQAPTFETWLEG